MEEHDLTQIRSVDKHESNSLPTAARGAPLAIGSRIGNFQVERILGIGGFGIVYLAVQEMTGRQVAIKEYFPSTMLERVGAYAVQLKSEDDKNLFMMGMRSFVKEATLLSSLSHEGLVQVLHFWEEHGTAYMVMPYYDGQPLSRYLLQKDRVIDAEFISQLLAQLLPTLAYLHERNIFHRDISPDNIFLLKTGQPILLDFGAARRIVDKAENVTVILKSGYAPIEQYDEHGEQGAWTDIYALSALLYKLITGQAPQASAARMYHDTVTPLATEYAAHYPMGLLHAIDAGLSVKPDQRPATIALWKSILESDGSQPWQPDDSVITFRTAAKSSTVKRLLPLFVLLALIPVAYVLMQPDKFQLLVGAELRKSYGNLDKQLTEQQALKVAAEQKVATLQARIAEALPRVDAPLQQSLIRAQEGLFNTTETYHALHSKYSTELVSLKQKMTQAEMAKQQDNHEDAKFWYDAAEQQLHALQLWRNNLQRQQHDQRSQLIKELTGTWAVKSCKNQRLTWGVEGKLLQITSPNQEIQSQDIIAAYDQQVVTRIVSGTPTNDAAQFVHYRYHDGKIDVTTGQTTQTYVLCGASTRTDK